MRPVLTSTEMRVADRATIDEIGLPGVVLMENAGAAVARVVDETVPAPGRILVLCGKGNNGGDGFVVARRLLERGPRVVLLARRTEVMGDARTHLDALLRAGAEVEEAHDEVAWSRCRDAVWEADVIVDAMLGTGLERAPRGIPALVVSEVVEAREAGVPVIAVDLPSGLPSDSGEVDWPSVVASTTVTFAALKCGHVLSPACERAGSVVVVDIGIPRTRIDAVKPSCFLLEDEDARRAFLGRAISSHKGNSGRVLVVAGSVGKTGAACLAAEAALRAGAGLVTIATARSAQAVVAAACREIMTEGLAETERGRIAAEALEEAVALAAANDVVVLGPGLGTDESTRRFVQEFVAACPVPIVVDADGLNALAGAGGVATEGSLWKRSQTTIVTPHPGEAARLLGSSPAEVQMRRLESARALARLTNATVVLKGYRTVVACPDGSAAVNPTGNPGLATAGTGDVLAGIVGATAARCDPWLAAYAAVFVHGRAADLVTEHQGQTGLLASDLLSALPGAIDSLGREAPCVR